jgi:hypothetical protein
LARAHEEAFVLIEQIGHFLEARHSDGLAQRVRRDAEVRLGFQVAGLCPAGDLVGDWPAPEVSEQVDGRDDRFHPRPVST